MFPSGLVAPASKSLLGACLREPRKLHGFGAGEHRKLRESRGFVTFWAASVAPWPLLGRCWAPLGPLLALLGPLWGRLWHPPAPFWAALRASWASLGGPWSALGGLFGALGRKPENRRQYSVFLGFSGLRGPSWGLLGASGRLLERPSGPESGPVGPSGSESGPWRGPVAPEVAPGLAPRVGPESPQPRVLRNPRRDFGID